MQNKDELLGASDGEGGNDDFAAARAGAVDDIGEGIGDLGERLVEAAAVSAFHNQIVGGGKRFGVADDGKPGPADVAGKGKTDFLAVGGGFKQHKRRSQHVAGV